MIFFEDCNVPKNYSIGITNLLSNITTRPGSHKGGWARLLKCQLLNLGYENVTILNNKYTLKEFDVIIFDLGAEYSGALNLFGGLDEKVFKRLNEIKEYRGLLFSWKNELPDVSILESRRHNISSCEVFKSSDAGFLGIISEVLGSTKVFDHVYRTESLLIGDSHTPSIWTPDFMIERRDGRTLKGMTENKTIDKHIKKFDNLKQVTVHCSSIDIRHHACREQYPKSYILQLSQELITQLIETGLHYNISQTMGIEDESRELPKTGYFKGTAFYGAWAERNELRNIFNGSLNLWLKGREILLPEYFFDETGKLKFDVMENGGSVHISPEHYRWDLDNNRDRWNHEEGR